MGIAVWEFMWCIDRVTKIDKDGVGWVLGGKPIKLEEIGMGSCRITVSRNLKKLKTQGYIIVIYTPYGIKIGVNKAKKSFNRSVKPTLTEVLNLDDKSVKPNKTVSVDNNNKTLHTSLSASVKTNMKEQYDENKFSDEYDVIPTDEFGNALPSERKPKNSKLVAMTGLLKWAEARRGGKRFVNWKKQFTAMKKMKEAKISPTAIKERWEEMENDNFWKDKGFDFMSVANSFDRKTNE